MIYSVIKNNMVVNNISLDSEQDLVRYKEELILSTSFGITEGDHLDKGDYREDGQWFRKRTATNITGYKTLSGELISLAEKGRLFNEAEQAGEPYPDLIPVWTKEEKIIPLRELEMGD